MGLHSVSSAIKIIIYNQLTLRKENVTQPLEKEVLRFYLKVANKKKLCIQLIFLSKKPSFLSINYSTQT